MRLRTIGSKDRILSLSHQPFWVCSEWYILGHCTTTTLLRPVEPDEKQKKQSPLAAFFLRHPPSIVFNSGEKTKKQK